MYKIKDSVELVNLRHPGSHGYYETSDSNTIGNKGIIIEFTNDLLFPYRIQWNNGSTNSYSDYNLRPIGATSKPKQYGIAIFCKGLNK